MASTSGATAAARIGVRVTTEDRLDGEKVTEKWIRVISHQEAKDADLRSRVKNLYEVIFEKCRPYSAEITHVNWQVSDLGYFFLAYPLVPSADTDELLPFVCRAVEAAGMKCLTREEADALNEERQAQRERQRQISSGM